MDKFPWKGWGYAFIRDEWRYYYYKTDGKSIEAMPDSELTLDDILKHFPSLITELPNWRLKMEEMTPEWFEREMAELRRVHGDDEDAIRCETMNTMCVLLRSLGYEDGVNIFREG